MLQKRQIIKALLDSASVVKNPNDEGSANELKSLSNKVVAFESDQTGSNYIQIGNLPTLNRITLDSENAVSSAITTLVGKDSAFTPNASQTRAMSAVAKYVSSPQALNATISMLSEGSDSYATIDNRSVNTTALDLGKVISFSDVKSIVPSAEAFDPQRIENSIRYSMVVNFMCSRQDDFGEAFFPTVTIDTVNSGFRMDIESFDFVSDFNREIDGSIDDDKFNRKSLVKSQYDNDILLKDYNKVFPIFRKGTNDIHFLTTITRLEKVGDEEVTVAPLTVGAEHNLLGLSQTQKTLNSGLYNNTDSLDRRIELRNLYIQIQGETADKKPLNEIVALPTEGIATAIFQAAPIGNSKALTLNFDSKVLGLNTSKTKLVDGTASKILGALTADHAVELTISVSGKANTQTGTVSVYANKIVVTAVRTADGAKLDKENATYKAITTALAKLSIVGFDLNAGRTNTNLRTRGQRLEINRYSETYPVLVRSDILVELPIDLSMGDESDIGLVDAQVTAIGAYCSAHAVDTIIRTADKLREMKANGTLINVDRFEGMSIGRYYVDGYYYSESVDVAAQMDSREANRRFDDVRKFLLDKIYNLVVDMAIESKYLQVFRQLYGKDSSAKISVVIGTDPSISKFLLANMPSNVIELGSNYQAVIVDTPNPRIKGKMYISFTILDENRNNTVNALNFGQMLWAPAIVLDLGKPEGGAYTRTVRSIPRYWHQVNLPIMAELTISDTKNAFNKNPVHFKQV